MKNQYLLLLLSFILVKATYSQENIKLRSDRDVYIAGESIWLNINCFDYNNEQVIGASKVVYVELLNQTNTPVKQVKVFLENGSSTSKMDIPDSCSTGNFQLRAYTRWMKNFDVALFESKIVTIINPFVRKRFPVGEFYFATDTLVVDMEGGKALTGVENNLLIRSYSRRGVLQKTEGIILDPKGDSLTTLTINKEGIVKYPFTPEIFGNYVYQIEVDDEHVLNLPFITAVDDGVVLSFIDESSLDVRLVSKSINRSSEQGEVHVLTKNGFLLKKIKLENVNDAQFSISKDEIKTNDRFLNICLLNNNQEIIASRIIEFRKFNNQAFNIALGKRIFEKREEVGVKITKTEDLSHVSISVIPEASLSVGMPFYSHLSLSKFEQYKLDKLARKGLTVNHLLVGVKPVEQFVFDNKFKSIPELEGEIISGRVIGKNDKNPIKSKRFALSFVSEIPQLYLSDTDSSGNFKFIVNEFGEQDMIIQPLNYDKDSLAYNINLDQAFCERYDKGWQHPLVMSNDSFAKLNEMVVNMQINTLYEQYQSFQMNEINRDNKHNFYGNPLYVTTIEKFIDLPNMEEVFNEIVGVVYVRKTKGKYEMHIVDDKTIPAQSKEVLIMIDGVPVWDLEKVMQIYPLDIKKIEVVNLNYYLEDNNLGYVLSIFTNKGDLSVYNFNKDLFRQSRMGLSPDYHFSTPDYESDSIGFDRIADFRNTLFWNTNVDFGKEGNANIKFFSADCKGKYKVIVQGINKDGVIRKSEISFVIE